MHFFQKLVEIEILYDPRRLALFQRSDERKALFFFLFEKSKAGANDIARRAKPTLGDLPVDEIREVVAQRD